MEYDLNKLAYNSFVWNFGTTSFRTKQLNFSIERQLALLEEFWKDPENAKCGWEKEYVSAEQPFDIYEIKNRYYDFMNESGFISGNEEIKYKTAREKTSGLVDIGVINRNHRLTSVGYALLNMSRKGDYHSDNFLSISADSLIYLSQLLKYSLPIKGGFIRPFVVLIHLLNELGSLSFEEFTFLAPLCISKESTNYILEAIPKLRNGELSLDDIIYSQIIKYDNYREAYAAWMDNKPSEELICAIGINRKSRNLDKPYFPLYHALKGLFLHKNMEDAAKVYSLTKKISIGSWWRKLLFDSSNVKAIQHDPETHLNKTLFSEINSESDLKRVFFRYLHLFKVKSTLSDYFDLNRRYIKLANVILFEDCTLKLDLVPKQLFKIADEGLCEIAFSNADNLEELTSLDEVCTALRFNEEELLQALNSALGLNLSNIEEAYTEVDRERYERFNAMVKSKFSDDKLIELLNNFDSRNDEAISNSVSDNADIPTIFEYILGIIWYKTSEYKGRILDYLKLSLDADLLPVTHAAGGEADIVYEYAECAPFYPKHNLLLEATLADGTNQRRMEMEPVSRHLGRHLLRTKNSDNYCVFATTYLDANVISDFKARKFIPFIDPQNPEEFVSGMKIIPLDTSDLRHIILQGKKYRDLYSKFEEAYRKSEEFPHPLKWYKEKVSIL